MATKKKFLAKHGLAVNTETGSTATLNYPTEDGNANQFMKTDGSGTLSFASVADNFLALTDTPASFSGNNGKGVTVNAAGNGLEFGGGVTVNSVNRHALTGNGGTAFTLGTTYSSGIHILVFVDGVIQNTPANYSLSGTTLTFTSAPAVSADILVIGMLPTAGIIDVGNLMPDVTNTRDLGSTTKRWDEIYAQNININTAATISGTLNGHTVPAGTPGGEFLLANDLTVAAEGTPTGNGALAYNSSSKEFTYTPPTPAGIGAIATGGSGATLTDLNASNLASGSIPNSVVPVGNVTQHQASLSITQSQITDLSTTDHLTEGSSNLYFTNERVDDRVGALLQAGTNITLNYDDASNTLTINSTQVEDNLSNNTTDDLSEGSTNLYYTNARADGRITNVLQDDDNFASASSTNIASSESIKAYADTKLALAGGTMAGAIDMGSNNITTTGKILFANMYATEGDLPSATTYHGMFAHVHATGAGYFAHGGNWIKLANNNQLGPITSANSSVNSPVDGEVLAYNGTNWINSAAAAYSDEKVDDRVNGLLVAGSGISKTYDDANNTLSLTATGMTDLSNDATPDLGGPLRTVGNPVFEQWQNANSHTGGSYNFYLTGGNNTVYATSNQASNTTLQVANYSGNDIDNLLGNGESVSLAFLLTNGGTGYYITTFNILTGGSYVTQTVKYVDGNAPSTGNINAVDVYHFTIFKVTTGNYTVFGQRTKFA